MNQPEFRRDIFLLGQYFILFFLSLSHTQWWLGLIPVFVLRYFSFRDLGDHVRYRGITWGGPYARQMACLPTILKFFLQGEF